MSNAQDLLCATTSRPGAAWARPCKAPRGPGPGSPPPSRPRLSRAESPFLQYPDSITASGHQVFQESISRGAKGLHNGWNQDCRGPMVSMWTRANWTSVRHCDDSRPCLGRLQRRRGHCLAVRTPSGCGRGGVSVGNRRKTEKQHESHTTTHLPNFATCP